MECLHVKQRKLRKKYSNNLRIEYKFCTWCMKPNVSSIRSSYSHLDIAAELSLYLWIGWKHEVVEVPKGWVANFRRSCTLDMLLLQFFSKRRSKCIFLQPLLEWLPHPSHATSPQAPHRDLFSTDPNMPLFACSKGTRNFCKFLWNRARMSVRQHFQEALQFYHRRWLW